MSEELKYALTQLREAVMHQSYVNELPSPPATAEMLRSANKAVDDSARAVVKASEGVDLTSIAPDQSPDSMLIHVLKFPDGKFLVEGFDCADRFVSDPLRASWMTIYTTERDTNEYKDKGAIIVQYAITATPTGLTCADIFKDERARIAAHQEELRLEAIEAERIRAEEDAEQARILAKTLGISHT